MKKEEIFASFEKIQPDEKLIRETLDRIELQKVKQERKLSFFSASHKLASAMCALAIVICVGIFAGKDTLISPVEDTPDAYAPSSFALNALPKEADDEPLASEEPDDKSSDAAEQAGATLLSRAAELSGDWQVVQGTLDGIYFTPDENGTTKCLTAITLEKVLGFNGDSKLSLANGCISASTSSEVDIASAMGSRVCVILTATEQSGETVWQINDFLICD